MYYTHSSLTQPNTLYLSEKLMIPLQPKHIALAPVYLYQGLKLKKTALRLPEAEGERRGRLTLAANDNALENSQVNDNASPDKPTLNIMLLGDSSAAGVGVGSQQQALAGQLIEQLQLLPQIQQKFSQLEWSLHATSGHTSFDALRRLYVLPTPSTPVDILIVMIGVNDTTSNVSTTKWQQQLREIISLSKRKFGAKQVIFPCLPPMQNMPAIPSPLNKLMGQKTQIMNEKLIQVCEQYEKVLALQIQVEDSELKNQNFFAEDGFHPNSNAYLLLAKNLANTISELV